jgi:hypothetical protein
MTPAETERMRKLCEQITVEKDQDKFLELVTELNDLLEQKNKRLDNSPSAGIRQE